MTKELTHKEVSSRGGKSKLNKYGVEVLSEMGKKGGNSLKKKMGPDYYKELQKKSVESRKRNKELKNQPQDAILTD